MAPISAISCSERLAAKLRVTRSARNNRPQFRALNERNTIRKMEVLSLTIDGGFTCGDNQAQSHLKTSSTITLRKTRRRPQPVSAHFLQKGRISKRGKVPLGSTGSMRTECGGSTKRDRPTFTTIPPINKKRTLDEFLDSNDEVERTGHHSKRIAITNNRASSSPNMWRYPNLAKVSSTPSTNTNPATLLDILPMATISTIVGEVITMMAALSLRRTPRAKAINDT